MDEKGDVLGTVCSLKGERVARFYGSEAHVPLTSKDFTYQFHFKACSRVLFELLLKLIPCNTCNFLICVPTCIFSLFIRPIDIIRN